MKCFGLIIVTISLMVLTGCQTVTTSEISSNEPLRTPQQYQVPTPEPTHAPVVQTYEPPVQQVQQVQQVQPIVVTEPMVQQNKPQFVQVRQQAPTPQPTVQSSEKTFFSFDCALGTIKYILYSQTDERGTFDVVTICLAYSGKSGAAQNTSPQASQRLQEFLGSHPELVQEFEDGPAIPLYQAFLKEYQFDTAHEVMWKKLFGMYQQFGVSMTHLVYLHPNVMRTLAMTRFTSHNMMELMDNSTRISFDYDWRNDVDPVRKKIHFTKNKRVNDAVNFALQQILKEEQS